MKPIGIDLGKMASGEVPALNEAPSCPGAQLRVTRDDLKTYIQGGEIFLEGPPMPKDGYGSVRVACRASCEEVSGGKTQYRQWFGLCRSCSQIEEDNRAVLRNRMGGNGKADR